MSEYAPGPWQAVHIALTAGPPLLRVQAVYGNPQMDDSQLAPVMVLGEGVNAEGGARLIAQAPALMGVAEMVALLGPGDPGVEALKAQARVIIKEVKEGRA